MRAAITETLAEKGVHRVAASFEDLRWGPVINKPHDLGTDIFVQVWPRGFAIGVVIGVQVKTGDSYFGRPEGDPSAPDGWWYPEVTKDHFDYWTGHALPHLLVLHDDQKDISHWVHVTADAVKDTGKGAKILVPSENTLDAAHVEALLAVAGTARSNVPFEGTAWTGGAATASTDQLRLAMIAPRLIATRQRDWFQEAPTPEQVVAMVARAQFDMIDNLRDPGNAFLRTKPSKKIPPIVEAASSRDWRWRFSAALEARIMRDDLAPLEACVETADMPDRKAAATVALVSACIEHGQYAEAVTYLDAAIDPDDMAPVDNAWLHIQRARIQLELGDLAAARADANQALGVRNIAPHDVTASAIDGSAQALIFTTASWEGKDFGSVIQSADTAVSWWRAQTTLGGLEAVTERTFKTWAGDRSTTIGGSDQANNQLYVAALAAGHAGDHGAWRHLFTLLAQDSLLRLDSGSPVEKVAEGIRMLRQAGADKALKQALLRVANDGPCRAITAVADGLDLDRSTHTTIFADLALVQHAGDLFDLEAARRCLQWLAASFDDPARLLTLATSQSFDPQALLLETMSGLTDTIPDDIADFVVSRLPQADLRDRPLVVVMWQRLLQSLPSDIWTPARIEALIANGIPDDQHPLRYPILGVAKTHNSAAKDVIEHELLAGSLQALLAARYVNDLDDALLVTVRDRLKQAIQQVRTAAAAGKTTIGGLDPAYVLGVILLSHPSDDDASCLAELLADEAVARSNKQPLLELMAGRAAEFRVLLGDQLLDVVERAAQAGPKTTDPTFSPDITGEGIFITEVLKAREPDFGIAFGKLLAGTASHRKWAAHLAAQAPGDHYASALLTLIRDQDPLVRTQAAGGIARLAVSNRGSEAVLDALRVAATGPGRAAPIAIAAELGAADELPAGLEAIRASLVDHPSAAVRIGASRRR
jgi:tetratricopeptide (TPR) repeat protein